MEKKSKHPVKHPKKVRAKRESKAKVKSDNVLTKKSDDDGVLIFQYELSKPFKVIKKLTRHLADQFTNKDNGEECKAWGLKV
ncbi:MAG: hypothetical protein WC635_09025 [Bacteriovorax sp.]